jgi:hypothetical protein
MSGCSGLLLPPAALVGTSGLEPHPGGPLSKTQSVKPSPSANGSSQLSVGFQSMSASQLLQVVCVFCVWAAPAQAGTPPRRNPTAAIVASRCNEGEHMICLHL